MGSAIACYDDWSPSIDSLLEWLMLEKLSLISPNPTPKQVEKTRSTVDQYMPLEKGDAKGEWYWKASSPCYYIQSEEIDKYRKRWDYQETALNWGKRKAKWGTSEGAEKNYDLPLYLRLTSCISWYVVGNEKAIASLLENCKGLGKKRSYGFGQVLRWDVVAVQEDWHLWRDGKLMRPMPVECINNQNGSLLQWGWRPPAWLHSNQDLCVMPQGLVCRA